MTSTRVILARHAPRGITSADRYRRAMARATRREIGAAIGRVVLGALVILGTLVILGMAGHSDFRAACDAGGNVAEVCH